jgi:hypothetical protein
VSPELAKQDPYNKLLARGPRFRVPAEIVRDIALEASGLLIPEMGGPPVFPYQPDGIWNVLDGDRWVTSNGEGRYRRGIYTFIRRSAPYPSFTTFDAPSRVACTVNRPRTNTPLQALTTLNDPAFFEAAQALAKCIITDVGSDLAARATYGFRRCGTRYPTPLELNRLIAFYRQQLEHYQKDLESAREVIKGYEGPPSLVAEQAAWTIVANVLLDMDPTITKE